MLIGKFEPYNGVAGTIEYDGVCHYGRLLGIKESDITDSIVYQAADLEALYERFKDTVDDYQNRVQELWESRNVPIEQQKRCIMATDKWYPRCLCFNHQSMNCTRISDCRHSPYIEK